MKKFFLFVVILTSVTFCGLLVYERTQFGLESFSFEIENATYRQMYYEGKISFQQNLSRVEMDEIMVTCGMNPNIVQYLEVDKLYEFIQASNIEVYISYFRINRWGECEYILADDIGQIDLGSEKWLYLKKTDFLFTIVDDLIADKHEIVTQIELLSVPQWEVKCELAVGTTESAIHFDTVKCEFVGCIRDNQSFHKDLTETVSPIHDFPYIGVRMVDKIQLEGFEEAVLYVRYQFGYNGKTRDFVSQFKCKQIG